MNTSPPRDHFSLLRSRCSEIENCTLTGRPGECSICQPGTYSLHPLAGKPLHPKPCTLHSTPYTRHPTPYTLHPSPYTLHPTPHNTHPMPYTLNPGGSSQYPDPACLPCPAGGFCSGGNNVTFAVGEWGVVESVWVLLTCPIGYACTMHPAPCTLHPAPCPLHLAPCPLHPEP